MPRFKRIGEDAAPDPDDDTEVTRRFVFGGPAEGPQVELDLEVGMGQIEVRRVAS